MQNFIEIHLRQLMQFWYVGKIELEEEQVALHIGEDHLPQPALRPPVCPLTHFLAPGGERHTWRTSRLCKQSPYRSLRHLSRSSSWTVGGDWLCHNVCQSYRLFSFGLGRQQDREMDGCIIRALWPQDVISCWNSTQASRTKTHDSPRGSTKRFQRVSQIQWLINSFKYRSGNLYTYTGLFAQQLFQCHNIWEECYTIISM